MNQCIAIRILASLIVFVSTAAPAGAVQIQDVSRLKGSETNKIVGMGLVVGLNGTGDGGKFLPAMRPLAKMIGGFIDPNTSSIELKDGKSVALVTVTASLPANGVREGDLVDVQIATVGPAKSLKGGRLFIVPLMAPRPGTDMIFAFAEGSLSVEDEDNPTTAVIQKGAQLTRDIVTRHVQSGQVTLVIDEEYASWPVARNLATQINGELAPEGPAIARAIDPKAVVIEVPMWERADPATFLGKLMVISFPVNLMPTGARVVINEKTGTIVMTGDVEISPIAISHEGLTITRLTPSPTPDPLNPTPTEDRFIGVDPTEAGGAKLADLLEAFNQLKVDAQDRIEIIKMMDAAGQLHAQLTYE
jgi:flagellar P-ring protein FlgI